MSSKAWRARTRCRYPNCIEDRMPVGRHDADREEIIDSPFCNKHRRAAARWLDDQRHLDDDEEYRQSQREAWAVEWNTYGWDSATRFAAGGLRVRPRASEEVWGLDDPEALADEEAA